MPKVQEQEQEPTAASLVNQGAYGCLYYPGLRCNGNTMDDLRYATKLVVQDEVAANEVAVGNAIKNIVNYRVNFVPVIETCTVNLGKVRRNNPHVLDKCDVTNEVSTSTSSKPKFTLMKMPYIDSLYFYDYIGRMGDNKKKIISCIFDTYQYLVESIERLTEHGIVHHDLKLQNILMNLKTDTPIIIDFGLSIIVAKAPKAEFWNLHFYKYSPDYSVWPLETHVINYLQNETAAALTRADVETICEAFVNANDALSIFSKGFRARYLKACIDYHSRWVGAERDAAFAGLVAGWRTWDNYSLSIAYLQILGYISSNGFTDNHLIVTYVQLLLTNVHPDPARRTSVDDTKRTFTDLFYMKELFEMYDRIVDQFNPDAFIQRLSQR
jgi:serine/threonine protein kinase